MRLNSTFTRATLALFLLCAVLPHVARAQAAGGQSAGTGKPPQASARAAEGFPIERYLNIHAASSPALAPGGRPRGVSVERDGHAAGVERRGAGGWPEQLTFYTDRVDFVRWSPDGAGCSSASRAAATRTRSFTG
jgi:hypothetical protein